MRLPIIPLVIAVTLLGAVWYLFNATRTGERILDKPKLMRLADVDGIETEVAVTRDGNRVAVIASGDLWVLNLPTGERKQITRTPDPESFPTWMPDEKRVTLTRGTNTLSIDAETGAEDTFLPNATFLSWASTGAITFVRDRALWTATARDQNEKKLVDADPVPDVEIRKPRFSPDSLQIAFIKSQLGLRGEVWVVDTTNSMTRPLVSDRPAENPMDVAWINGGRDLAYLTNRAGAYSLWYVDLVKSTIQPLTQPLMTVPLAQFGMSVAKDRVVLPRHFAASKIALSDGTSVTNSDKLQFQPAASPNGNVIAYTVADENKFEVWTTSIKGDNPTFRTLGKEPRFSANGFQIVYTHTDLQGNDDIWKLDIRNGSAQRMTDADEIDLTPDWSPDAHSIAFASARGGPISIWTIPASGGKRLRITNAGYAPRYSPDSKSILFWNRQALWTMDADGKNLREVVRDVLEPAPGAWSNLGKTVSVLAKPPVDYPVWPGFDILPDGRFVVAPIEVRETSLWAIDLMYKEK